MNAQSSTGSSLFVTLLTISFIVLKLTDQIDWSWWWVLAPIWIPVLVGLVILSIFVLFYVLFKR